MLSFSTFLYMMGHLALAILLLLLRSMGKRLGKALEMPPYHRLYLASVFLLLFPLPVYWALVLAKGDPFFGPSYQAVMATKLLLASLPSAAGLTVAIYPTAKYWKWIWKELARTEGEA